MSRILFLLDRCLFRVAVLFEQKNLIFLYIFFSRIHSLFLFIRFYKKLPIKPASNYVDFLYHVRIGKALRSIKYRNITDKEFSKHFVSKTVGEKYVVPTLNIFSSEQELICYFPDEFPVVIKPTHSSGRSLVVKNESELLKNQSSDIFTHWLRHDYFYDTLEAHYRGLEKKIIVEPYIDSSFFLEASVHCRSGVPKVITLIDRFDPEKSRESYTPDFIPLEVSFGFPYKPLHIQKPNCWAALLSVAGQLACTFSYIRVDFYLGADNFLVGELTCLPAGAFAKFSSYRGNLRFNEAFFSD